jgi:manganese oxidase
MNNPSLTTRRDAPLAAPLTRRGVLAGAALAGGAALASRALARTAPGYPRGPRPDWEQHDRDEDTPNNVGAPCRLLPPGEAGRDYTPVIVPNGWTLPHKVVDGVKVFHLVAEEVVHEFAPGLVAACWGYNGSVHGPVLEAVEGDRVRVYVTNKLGAPTTVHWHGVLVPSGMDGVGGLSQKAIMPGETYAYEFTLRQHGTLMYHSHHDEMTQMGMGMTGLFVIHPRYPAGPQPDRDFAIMLHEWLVPVGTSRPDPNEMADFNILTMNGRCFPGTEPLIARLGDRVRIRLGNLGAMDHHPIHLHGYYFTVTETDGGVIPEQGRWPETTVLVPVGSTRTVEFVADNSGDWAMHCHMTHHVMNQMGHRLPNMIGVDPSGLDERVRSLLPGYMTMGQAGMGDMAEMGMKVPENSIPMVGGRGPHDVITMGGMFTILKVRESLPNGYADPGWYQGPEGTRALLAVDQAMQRDGISGSGAGAPRAPWPKIDLPRDSRAREVAPGGGGHGGHEHGGHE